MRADEQELNNLRVRIRKVVLAKRYPSGAPFSEGERVKQAAHRCIRSGAVIRVDELAVVANFIRPRDDA